MSAILVLRQNVQLVWSYVVFTIIENPVGVRHLDTMQFKTFINCKVPRVKSSQGVKTIEVPWADSFERHTYLFERLAIDLLKATKNQT